MIHFPFEFTLKNSLLIHFQLRFILESLENILKFEKIKPFRGYVQLKDNLSLFSWKRPTCCRMMRRIITMLFILIYMHTLMFCMFFIFALVFDVILAYASLTLKQFLSTKYRSSNLFFSITLKIQIMFSFTITFLFLQI